MVIFHCYVSSPEGIFINIHIIHYYAYIYIVLVYIYIPQLVGGLEHVFHNIWVVILPID